MKFVWIDGTALTYTNWAPVDPNDLDGTHDVVGMTGPYWPSFGKWVDGRADQQKPFICEKPARSTSGEIKSQTCNVVHHDNYLSNFLII